MTLTANRPSASYSTRNRTVVAETTGSHWFPSVPGSAGTYKTKRDVTTIHEDSLKRLVPTGSHWFPEPVRDHRIRLVPTPPFPYGGEPVEPVPMELLSADDRFPAKGNQS